MLDWFIQIEWFETYYVNREWLVYSMPKKVGFIQKKWRFLKPYSNKLRWWYCYVLLQEWDKRKNLLHHRIVANAFLPKIEWKDQINHIDWNKSNNCVDNLEWCTQSENAFHKYRVLKVPPSEHQKIVVSEFNSKPILQYSLDWEFIKEWKSATDARNNWFWKAIWHCLRWLQKQSHWYVWKYKNTL